MNAQKQGNDGKSPEGSEVKLPDPVAFARAMNAAWERALPLMNEYFEKVSGDLENQSFDPFNVRQSYMEFLERVAEDPQHYIKIQTDYWNSWMHIWQESMLKFLGQPSGQPVIKPEDKDRRFKAPEWQENALFDFIKQSYLLTCKAMNKTIEETRGLRKEDKRKLEFYTQLFANALSPTNFVLTNPEVLKETISTGGENLIRGMNNLLEDMERGRGELAISTTRYKMFRVGENLAATPGKVVYQNDLMQLIQYEPTTKDVYKKPLLIVPPWINKYYILDLKPENSFIKWAVDQGFTVFTISWVNPDSKLAQKRFENYMEEGVLSALFQIEKATGEKSVNAIGYCLGGTLLTTTLAYLAAKKQSSRVSSATFFTTLIDFEHAGDMKLFTDEEQLKLLDKAMAQKGILEGKSLQRTFSLLRANDMIWSFVVNNYLMGREPFPFDLLYWNDDATNMPAAMHSFYLRKMYVENVLCKPGGITMNTTPIDVSKIKTPAFFLSTREDHIAPWRATYAGAKLFSGEVKFTLAASGHTAGVVNHPDKNKYCYWSSDKLPAHHREWLDGAKEHEGSWWPYWKKWVARHGGEKIPARKIGAFLENAPGSYVQKKF